MALVNTNAPNQLRELADTVFRERLASDVFYAAQLGHGQYLSELPDISPAGREGRREQLAGRRTAAEDIDETALGDEDRITRQMIIRYASDQILTLDAAPAEYTVTPLPQTGLAASVIVSFPKALILSAADAEAYLARCGKLPDWMKEAGGLLSRGAADGRRPVRRLVDNAVAQLDGYLASSLSEDPIATVAGPPGDDDPAWRARLADAVRDKVRPALAAYRDFLATEVRPAARPDEQAGIAHLPGGTDLYGKLAAQHTTLDISVEEIHRTGLDLVAELTEEMRQLGDRVFGTADFDEIKRRLRTDTELYFQTSDEVAESARRAIADAERELPNWLGLLPVAPVVVRPMTPFEVENGDLGHYQWPGKDGTRPGTYWINTYKPHTRPRFESRVLAFHESVPGHHTQIAVAHELAGQSEFRRHAHATAFVEGWALYTERLADEMGLYTGDLDRLGTVSFDFWRACRLVVDTGMHAMGWSRDQAVTYMVEHSALTRKNIENEIDRYIGWPGQALGYMLGRLEIRKLRAAAESELGPRFDARGFHAEVIGHGALPLSVLGEVTRRWTAARAE
ncbi:MAG TPA: DUF885 domain-containing protein [Trebonia sp.]|nr:DUF885 domain-containing protein [Trebonia sp.]